MSANWLSLPHPMNIAHRGARGHAPENTLAAAMLGYDAGAHAWELDANLTKDLELVVIHDDTLSRTTDVSDHHEFSGRDPFRVCDFTLAELRTLNAGKFYNEKDPFGQIRAGMVTSSQCAEYEYLTIPTLEEALLFTKEKNWYVNVEIKNHSHLIGHEIVTQKVLDMIKKLDMINQVIISSFQHSYLLEAKKILPEIATGVLTENIRPEDPVALCRELGANAYHPGRDILAPGDLHRLRDAGFAINVWTVNDLDEAQQLIMDGATGIITDFPAKLGERLAVISH